MPQPDTSNLSEQALTCVEQGQLPEALRLFQSITEIDAANAEAWMMQGAIHRELCKPDNALTCLRRAIELDPDDADTAYYLAAVLVMQQAPVEAEKYAQRAVALDPEYGEAWLLLGGIHTTLAHHQDAEQAFRAADTLLPGRPEPQIGIASGLQAQGKSAEAAAIFNRVKAQCQDNLKAQPDNVEVILALADICSKTGARAQAITLFNRAMKIAPDNLYIYIQLATVLHGSGKGEEMLRVSEAAIRLAPDSIAGHMKVAEALELLGRIEEALQEARRILSMDANNTDTLAFYAGILEKTGNIEEGLNVIAPIARDAGTQGVHILLRYSALAKHSDEIYRAIELLEDAIQQRRASEPALEVALLFELGTLHDKVGAYDAAFETFRKANDAKHAILPMKFNPDAHTAHIDALISDCSRPLLSEHENAGNPSTLPVFIVGVPRSGTTLVEQILSSHPQVHGAGELTNIKNIVDSLHVRLDTTRRYPYCLDSLTDQAIDDISSEYIATLTALSNSAQRITDKMPRNFMDLGLIQILFPHARVIHCQRDPLDTCLSYYFHDFSIPHTFSYRLEDLGIFYNNYRRLMQHWRTVLDMPLLEIQYQDLVSDQDAMSRKLVDFCGLEWDDACIAFHDNKRFAATTSYDQVRKPMYTSSVGRWKNYEKYLQPLISTLEADIH